MELKIKFNDKERHILYRVFSGSALYLYFRNGCIEPYLHWNRI